jgi:BirA family biotin operon repressor/biotin-[acetyl-CoA-carboxylase] ligase
LESVERFCREAFVRHAEYFESLGSTNDRAAELAGRSELPTPALVVTRHQTAGRGRGEKTWWAGEGALTFSLVLDTEVQGIYPRDWPRLSLAAAVAVCDAIQAEGTKHGAWSLGNSSSTCSPPPAPCSIKWPNDVLLNGRKVAGILIESPGGAAPAKNRLIVGIGINMNNSLQAAPTEVRPSGTALCDVTGQQYELAQALLAVLRALEARFTQLANGDSRLPAAWQQLDFLANRRVVVETNGKRVECHAQGIGDDGALVVKTDAGPQSFYSGTVNWAI